MKEINKHPAPEKLLRQVTAETINGLELGGEIDHPSIIKLETAVGLIAKAWKLPQETLQSSIDLIQRQKQNILSGSGEGVLPPEEDLESYDGPMIVELLWGLSYRKKLFGKFGSHAQAFATSYNQSILH